MMYEDPHENLRALIRHLKLTDGRIKKLKATQNRVFFPRDCEDQIAHEHQWRADLNRELAETHQRLGNFPPAMRSEQV